MFVSKAISKKDIKAAEILEIGSYNINGSTRNIFELLEPNRYVGIDIKKGENVDVVCKIEDILLKFGPESFDVVIATELLEHVRDWRLAVKNIKNVLKKNGIAIITTRSRGFYYHPDPEDNWRYEISDMKKIFSDFEILKIEKDWLNPGVFLKVRKPSTFIENSLAGIALYNIVYNKRILDLPANTHFRRKIKYIMRFVFLYAHGLLNKLEKALFHL